MTERPVEVVLYPVVPAMSGLTGYRVVDNHKIIFGV